MWRIQCWWCAFIMSRYAWTMQSGNWGKRPVDHRACTWFSMEFMPVFCVATHYGPHQGTGYPPGYHSMKAIMEHYLFKISVMLWEISVTKSSLQNIWQRYCLTRCSYLCRNRDLGLIRLATIYKYCACRWTFSIADFSVSLSSKL